MRLDDAIHLLDDSRAPVTDKVKRLMNRDFESAEEAVEDSFEVFPSLLRRERRTEEGVEILLGGVDLRRLFLFGAFGLFDRSEPRFPLLFAGLVHAGERVLLVHNVPDARYQPLRLELVIGPAGVVIGEVDDPGATLRDAPAAQPRRACSTAPEPCGQFQTC